MSARLTVLTSVSGLYATKRIRQDHKTGRIVKTDYGREKHFRVQTVELSSFAHLCRCLDRLTQRTLAFVVRGEPLPGVDMQKARRLLHDDPETGEAATFSEAPRQWFAADIDKVRRPIAIDPVADPDGAIEHLIGLLPPELHDASCWWQFTCSQSLPGYEEMLSARLWFWLLEPLDDAALTRWARDANKAAGFKLLDDALYRAVQPHYVAAPIFDNLPDPLPRRHGVASVSTKPSRSLSPSPRGMTLMSPVTAMSASASTVTLPRSAASGDFERRWFRRSQLITQPTAQTPMPS
jgi:hypothetical protein